MYHFPDYVHAIHADRLRAAEAARLANACFSRQKRRSLLLHRRMKRPRKARVLIRV